jgi:hypothetical protein
MRDCHSPRGEEGIHAGDADSQIGIGCVDEEHAEQGGGGVLDLAMTEKVVDDCGEEAYGYDEEECNSVT